MALGTVLLVIQEDYEFVTGSEYASVGVLLLVAGAITALVSVLGIVAAGTMWATLLIIVSGLVSLPLSFLCCCVCVYSVSYCTESISTSPMDERWPSRAAIYIYTL